MRLDSGCGMSDPITVSFWEDRFVIDNLAFPQWPKVVLNAKLPLPLFVEMRRSARMTGELQPSARNCRTSI